MSSHYYTNVVYPTALEDAFDVLVQLKKSVESYKLKPNANQSWIERQENNLAKLMYFIEASKETFQVLEQEYSEAKKEGYRQGVRQTERKYKHKEEYGELRFDNPDHKERIRAATILNAQEKWNF